MAKKKEKKANKSKAEAEAVAEAEGYSADQVNSAGLLAYYESMQKKKKRNQTLLPQTLPIL